MSSASNSPDPTEYEGEDAVADTRHDIMEWLGNCRPIYEAGCLLVEVSPLALGIFVTSCLVGLEGHGFSEAEIATARGEVAHTPQARRLMEGVLGEIPAVNEVAARLLPDVAPADLGARAIAAFGPYADHNTSGYRDWMEKELDPALVARVDWHKLADDLSDEEPQWKRYHPDHDTRGCYDCLSNTCLVGLEDVDGNELEDDDQPDPVAMGHLARRALGMKESAPE